MKSKGFENSGGMKMSAEESQRLMWPRIDVIKVPPIRLSSELTEEEKESFEASIRRDGIVNPHTGR